MSFIRSLITLVLLGAFAYCGATVKLGDHTFFQHVVRIWKTDEAQEMADGVKEKSEPYFERFGRAIEELGSPRDAGVPADGGD